MKALGIVLLLPLTVVAAQDNGVGTKSIGMANAFVAVADDSWGISANAAGLVQCRGFVASAFFIPQQFGLPELRTIAASASFPVNPGTAAILVEQFGFELYRTTTIRIGYGILVSPVFALGVTAGLQRVAIQRYGSTTTKTVDLGCMGWPAPEIALGFALRNVTAATIGVQRERLPQSVHFGMTYSPLGGFSITSEIEKELQFPVVVKAGIDQTVLGFLSLRCGISDNPDKFSAGFAIRCAGVEFGYAGYSHTDLGWTHQLELTARFGGPG